MMVDKGNYPQMAELFRSVNCYFIYSDKCIDDFASYKPSFFMGFLPNGFPKRVSQTVFPNGFSHSNQATGISVPSLPNLVMTNIAMEAMALIEIDGLPIKMVIFHGYVK